MAIVSSLTRYDNRALLTSNTCAPANRAQTTDTGFIIKTIIKTQLDNKALEYRYFPNSGSESTKFQYTMFPLGNCKSSQQHAAWQSLPEGIMLLALQCNDFWKGSAITQTTTTISVLKQTFYII